MTRSAKAARTEMTRPREYKYNPTPEESAGLIEAIKGRCVECPECGALWSWTGNHQDKMHHAVIERNKVRVAVRKAVWMAFRGPFPRNRVLTTKCENVCCLNPELLSAVTRDSVVKKLMEQGRIHTPAHLAARTLARRARGTKLSMEIAREIRLNPDVTAIEYAEKFNVHLEMIRRIRRNKSYADGNPFSGLMR